MEVGKAETNSLFSKAKTESCDQLESVSSGCSKNDFGEKLREFNILDKESIIDENKDKILIKGKHESSNKRIVKNKIKKRNTCEEDPRITASLNSSDNQNTQKRIILRRGVNWKTVGKSCSDDNDTSHFVMEKNSNKNTSVTESWVELPAKENKHSHSQAQLVVREPSTDEIPKSLNKIMPHNFNIRSSKNKCNNTSTNNKILPVVCDKNQSEQCSDNIENIKCGENNKLSLSSFETIPTTSDHNSDFLRNLSLEKNCDVAETQESNNSDTGEESDQLFVPLLFGSDILHSNECVTETDSKSLNGCHSFSEVSSHKSSLKVNREELESNNDSDEMDDMWHHKNIKEKIKNILGQKLNLHRYKIEGDTKKYVGKNVKTIQSTKGNKDVDSLERFSRTSSLANTNYNNNELDIYSKNSIPNFMNLTYFTDSDEDAETTLVHPDCLKSESIVNKWELLEAKAREKQLQLVQVSRLQWQLKSVRMTLENISNSCSAYVLDANFESFSQISINLDKMKSLINECNSLKSDISALNAQIHRHSLEIAPSVSPLKEEITDIYHVWDETHLRVQSELSRLEQIEATYRAWEEQKVELSRALKQDSDALKVVNAAVDNGKLTESVTASVRDVAKLLNENRKYSFVIQNKDQFVPQDVYQRSHELKKKEDHLSDSGTSGYESCSSDDLSERERRLAYLKRLAKDLEASLAPGCSAWKEINSTLDQAEKELKDLQDHCRYLILKTTETFEPNSKNLCFSSNSKRRILARDGKNMGRNTRREKRMKILGSRRDWMWRVARAAAPFQIALMLLVCVACLLQPNCCDSVNTFNNSFTPQLRFVHGSPPI